MATVQHHDPPRLADQSVRRVLYVGGEADEICHFVTQHVGEIDVIYELKVAGAIQRLRSREFDVVMVDLRHEQQSLRLLLPLVSDLGPRTKLVVISTLNDVSQYLAVPGVARVLASPVREGQFLRILGLASKRKHYATLQHHSVDEVAPQTTQRNLIQFVLDRAMVIISMLYKRSAAVLLFTLFTAFLFYGFLIAFFLLSSSWGAPMTLVRGHEMVNKVEREITELRVALSQAEQKITEAQFARGRAERELGDGEVMIKYAFDTVKKELSKVRRSDKTLVAKISRLERVRNALERQLAKDGMSGDLAKLYDKRLINRKTFNSSALGLLEASQRLAGIENELDALVSERENLVVTVDLLTSLRDGLNTGEALSTITGASSDLILLTKQAVDAKAAFDNAYERISSSDELIAELLESRKVIKRQLAGIEVSALARAMDKRIDVIFVPYTNRASFLPGTSLYSCAFTVFYCEIVGSAGAPLPGEIASVHPFFGKPIRGYFVEAKLKLDQAATREIIHGGRKPFFF